MIQPLHKCQRLWEIVRNQMISHVIKTKEIGIHDKTLSAWLLHPNPRAQHSVDIYPEVCGRSIGFKSDYTWLGLFFSILEQYPYIHNGNCTKYLSRRLKLLFLLKQMYIWITRRCKLSEAIEANVSKCFLIFTVWQLLHRCQFRK